MKRSGVGRGGAIAKIPIPRYSFNLGTVDKRKVLIYLAGERHGKNQSLAMRLAYLDDNEKNKRKERDDQ
jgi:hypothetical protein